MSLEVLQSAINLIFTMISFCSCRKITTVMLPSFREERKQTYSPFLPICPKTSQLLQVPIIERNNDKRTITYKDADGEEIEVPVTKGRCKLQWKPDWGMRWAAFGVNYEAHGKDLTPSAVLSSQICKILGEKPPLLFCYELFLDKEGKKISKSKGNGISIEEWLIYAATESLALYIFQSPKKAKRLHFDVIPKSIDEYLEFVKRYNESKEKDVNSPVWHIHQGRVPNVEISGINFSLLLNLAVACNAENKEILWGFISTYAPEVTPKNYEMLDRLSDFAVRYYHAFIKPTKAYKASNEKEKEALLDLKNNLHFLPITVTTEEIQSQIFSNGKKHN